jgi:putative ABC transport system substrate-binding protein
MRTESPKRGFGFCRELVPTAALVGILLNPTSPNAERQLKDVQEAARALGLQIHIVHASRERDFAVAFATLAELRAGAMLVGADPFFNSRRDDIVALAARHAIPAIYEQREHVVAGGLMSTAQRFGRLSPSRPLHWPHSQGRETG